MNKFNPSAWAIKEKSLTLFLILVALISGTYAFLTNGRAEDPVFSVNTMVVSAYWPGATTEQMENLVADPLEKRLEEIDWFDRVETKVRPGQVEMLVNFSDATPQGMSEQLFYQVRKRLGDEAKKLPPGVIGPIFQDDFKDVYFTLYALTSEDRRIDNAQLVKVAEKVRIALRRVEGVKRVLLIGERKRQLFVELDEPALTMLGVSAAEVQQQIAAQVSIVSAGFVETQGPRLHIRVGESPKDWQETLKALPIQTGKGVVTLSQLARVYQGYEDPPSLLIRDHGKEAVLLGVVMKENADGLKLEKALEQFEQTYFHLLPAGVQMDKLTNQADAIHRAVDIFQEKFFVALLVVMVVSFIALGLRAGIVVALAVPLTLAITFVFMKATGIDFNRISLGALIIALGLLVDDAIIAIEMMLLKMEQGLDKIRAASYAWTLTAAPMLVGTLLTVVGFLPIGIAQSGVGEYAGGIFWVTGIALITSWLVAVLFTPYLGVALLPDKLKTRHKPLEQRPLFRSLRQVIAWCVRYKWLVIAFTILIFVASVVGMKQFVVKQFFPNSDRPELMIDIYLPEGSSFAATQKVVERMEQQLQGAQGVKSVATYIGRGAPRFFLALNPELPNPAYANIVVVTENWQVRDQLQASLLKQIEAGAFAEARVRVRPLMFGPPVPWPVTFRILGPDAEQLITIGDEILARMKPMDFLIDPHLSWRYQTPSLKLVWDQQRLMQLGLTPAQVAEQVRLTLNGQIAALVPQGIRATEVRLRGEGQLRHVETLENIPIRLPAGQSVPLGQLASIEVVNEYPLIERRNRERVVSIYAEITPDIQPPDATMKVWREIQDIVSALPPGYRIEIGGSVEESTLAEQSIKVNMPLMLLLVAMLIMLYMRSFTGLFMVLITAPLGLVGAVAALLLFNQPFGFVANLGLIALGGILMRNTLILVAQIDENQRKGMPVAESVIDATVTRARPVLLTAAAAVLAFIPLTTSLFWGPMAYVLISGIAVGTLITLFFLPALYAVWYRVKMA